MKANAGNAKYVRSGQPVSRRPKASSRVKKKLEPYLYITPAMGVICLLMLVPMATVIKYSFVNGAITNKNPSFSGLENYKTLFQDPLFWDSASHTLYFTAMSVFFHLLIGLIFALLLNSNRVTPAVRSLLRVLYILPWLFTAVIVAVIWRLMLEPEGIVNSIFLAMHIITSKMEWLSSTRTAIHALTFINIWAGYPLYMVTILAALQGIPKDLYEAADVDGANLIEKFRYITLPQLKPIIMGIALLDIIWTTQVFPLVWMTTGGGPIYATEMLSTYTYKLAFTRYQFSLAAASAITILFVSICVTYFYIRHQRTR